MEMDKNVKVANTPVYGLLLYESFLYQISFTAFLIRDPISLLPD